MRILFSAILIVISFVVAYILHAYALGCGLFPTDCPLFLPYVYLLLFALAVVIVFTVLSRMPKMQDQLGFMYLGALLLKLFLFAVFFRNQIFAETAMDNISTAHYLAPVFLGLLCEVAFLGRILKNITPKS